VGVAIAFGQATRGGIPIKKKLSFFGAVLMMSGPIGQRPLFQKSGDLGITPSGDNKTVTGRGKVWGFAASPPLLYFFPGKGSTFFGKKNSLGGLNGP